MPESGPMNRLSRGFRGMSSAVIIVIAVLAVGAASLFAASLTSRRPAGLGVHNDRLAACPSSPNCVSTQAEDREHWIRPIDTEHADPLAVIRQILQQLPRVTIVSDTDTYLHAEFRSRLFRFPDDVEFFCVPDTGRIHFRSASRLGHSDLGVNRARMEQIRERFLQAVSGQSATATNPDGKVVTAG